MNTKAITIRIIIVWFLFLCFLIFIYQSSQAQNPLKYSFPIVDTGVKTFYNNHSSIKKPEKGEAFYGQDAQYTNNAPSYKDNGDGTITDLVTGLMWQKALPKKKYTYQEALQLAKDFSLAGYDDWRLPDIKELYSLIMFYGEDPSGERGDATNHLQPFINTKYFNFRYGNPDNNERIIDAQYASSTTYIGTTMNGNPTVFGVNFADGRIKGYPITSPHGKKLYEVRLVRGNTEYGKNKFISNNNGTISDEATGLMWSQDDSKKGMNWKEALEWVQQKNNEKYLGYNDWRLPDAKELQSIVDYSHAPVVDNLPAINPLFTCSGIKAEGGNKDYPFYWTSTTHANSRGFGDHAVYISFGTALGWMPDPYNHKRNLMDVHGAGAQRSDPKTGNPKDYPYGWGPQGDVQRIYNYVRLVRSID